MAEIDKMKVKLTLTIEQLDSLDDLLDLYLDEEGNARQINHAALIGVREKVSNLMDAVSRRLDFSSVRKNDVPKYLM
jgi:hypothetical protein